MLLFIWAVFHVFHYEAFMKFIYQELFGTLKREHQQSIKETLEHVMSKFS